MQFADALELGKPRRTKEGYMAVRARAARTGVYQYSGQQVDPDNKHGLRDQACVNVLRDDATVFDTRAAQSFVGKPITVDHPAEVVTAANWKDHARGAIMGALRDGDYLAFDLLLMDQAAIADVEAGKRELSNGYGAELAFGDFTAPCGTKCPVRQSQITGGNHVAIVDAGRAGPECRISDGGNALFAACDTATVILNLADAPEEKPVKTMLIDGLTVDLGNADTAIATVTALRDARDQARGKVTELEAKAVTDAATIVAKDAEITKLTSDLAAAKLTPAQMRDAGKAFAVIEGKAKALGVAVTDAMDQDTIMKAVVDKAMPGNSYTGEHIVIAFEALTKDVKPAAAVTPIGAPVVVGDAATEYAVARDKRKAALSDAWRKPFNAADAAAA